MKPWSAKTKQMVTLIYGMVMGTIIISAILFVAMPHMVEDGLTKYEGAFLVVMMLFGLIAALPGTFMQVLGQILSFLGGLLAGLKGRLKRGGDS